jgi:hypothetical protein
MIPSNVARTGHFGASSALAIAGSCAVIALLAAYVQKTKSLEKVTGRVEAVTVD